MRLSARIFALLAMVLVSINAVQANDIYTWKPGKLKVPGTLTVTGVSTFTGAAAFNGGVSTPFSSASIAPDVVQHATVALSSANILAMNATPVQLIAAPAAGKNIIVQKVMLTMVTTATQYASGGVVVFQIGNTAAGAGTATTGTIAAAVVNAAAGTSYTTVVPVAYTGTAATGLFISNQTGAFTTGTGTGTVDIWYQVK